MPSGSFSKVKGDTPLDLALGHGIAAALCDMLRTRELEEAPPSPPPPPRNDVATTNDAAAAAAAAADADAAADDAAADGGDSANTDANGEAAADAVANASADGGSASADANGEAAIVDKDGWIDFHTAIRERLKRRAAMDTCGTVIFSAEKQQASITAATGRSGDKAAELGKDRRPGGTYDDCCALIVCECRKRDPEKSRKGRWMRYVTNKPPPPTRETTMHP